jgi:hypothetical protein
MDENADTVWSMDCPWCGRLLSIPNGSKGVPAFSVNDEERTITATRTESGTGKLLAISFHGGPGAFGCVPLYRRSETLDVAHLDAVAPLDGERAP